MSRKNVRRAFGGALSGAIGGLASSFVGSILTVVYYPLIPNEGLVGFIKPFGWDFLALSIFGSSLIFSIPIGILAGLIMSQVLPGIPAKYDKRWFWSVIGLFLSTITFLIIYENTPILILISAVSGSIGGVVTRDFFG